MRRLMFLTISQTNVNYRGSALSAGSAGRVEAGDRLPWVPQDTGSDNFDSLRSLEWQAHVYGAVSDETERACAQAGLNLQRFPWNEAADSAGIARDAFYLIRPDGYVGLAAISGAHAALRQGAGRRGLPRPVAEARGGLPTQDRPAPERRSGGGRREASRRNPGDAPNCNLEHR